MSKTKLGIPAPRSAVGVDLKAEARKGRRRLYPVTVVYAAYSLGVLGWALRKGSAPVVLAWFMAGVVLLTWLEYFTHRWVLHGIFPEGGTPWRRFLNRRFDDLHWRHHLEPWNGSYINGSFRDTLLFVAALAALSFLGPPATAPVLFAGVLLAYVAEEWVHHSVHFYRIPLRYFSYIKRHHVYHHSPQGQDIAFGLTNDLWDAVYGTRAPLEIRRRLAR